MKKRVVAVLVVLAFATLPLLGCAMAQAPTMGTLYTQVQGPIDYADDGSVTKTGRACAKNYLGLVATGDASIQAAKENGGIRNVVMVDHDTKIILGLYAEFCTLVRGN